MRYFFTLSWVSMPAQHPSSPLSNTVYGIMPGTTSVCFINYWHFIDRSVEQWRISFIMPLDAHWLSDPVNIHIHTHKHTYTYIHIHVYIATQFTPSSTITAKWMPFKPSRTIGQFINYEKKLTECVHKILKCN